MAAAAEDQPYPLCFRPRRRVPLVARPAPHAHMTRGLSLSSSIRSWPGRCCGWTGRGGQVVGASFCTHCGQAVTGTTFCTQCGRPIPAAAGPVTKGSLPTAAPPQLAGPLPDGGDDRSVVSPPHSTVARRVGAAAFAFLAVMGLSTWFVLRSVSDTGSGPVTTSNADTAQHLPTGGAPSARSSRSSNPEPTIAPPPDSRMCSSDVFAAGTASCPFALAVAEAFRSSNGAQTLSNIYSPATGKSYDVTCRGLGPTTCQTGRATIYIY